MHDLAGRAAVVTGGLTGQGAAIAHELAKAGANVAVGSYVSESAGRQGDAAAYPDPGEIAEVREALARHGTRVFAGHLDIRDTTVIGKFLAAAEDACGPPTSWSMPPAPRRAARHRPLRRALGEDRRYQSEWRLPDDP